MTDILTEVHHIQHILMVAETHDRNRVLVHAIRQSLDIIEKALQDAKRDPCVGDPGDGGGPEADERSRHAAEYNAAVAQWPEIKHTCETCRYDPGPLGRCPHCAHYLRADRDYWEPRT